MLSPSGVCTEGFLIGSGEVPACSAPGGCWRTVFALVSSSFRSGVLWFPILLAYTVWGPRADFIDLGDLGGEGGPVKPPTLIPDISTEKSGMMTLRFCNLGRGRPDCRPPRLRAAQTDSECPLPMCSPADGLTCRPAHLSTCPLADASTCQSVILPTCHWTACRHGAKRAFAACAVLSFLPWCRDNSRDLKGARMV